MWVGCEEKDYDHTPPPDQGAIILENLTGDSLDVFVDGQSSGRLGEYDELAIDLDPGVHRVVLDQRHGVRYGTWDVDVVKGRLTVVRIRISTWDWREYDAEFSIQMP